MAALPTLEKIRETIRGKIIAENLVNGSNGGPKTLYNGLSVVPFAAMWNNLQWIHEVILPKVLLHRGADSAEYKSYLQIRDSIIWCLHISNEYERLLLRMSNDKFLIEFYRDRCALLDAELLKYTTAENILTADSLRASQQSIVNGAISMLSRDEKK